MFGKSSFTIEDTEIEEWKDKVVLTRNTTLGNSDMWIIDIKELDDLHYKITNYILKKKWSRHDKVD